MKKVFITYNPTSEEEQILAVRLHTIGALNGFRMYLPDRYYSIEALEDETKNRIMESDWFVIFSTRPLSKIVRDEINYAITIAKKDPSRIIVIYSSQNGKNLKGSMVNKFKSYYFDPSKKQIDEFLKEIFDDISKKNYEVVSRKLAAKESENNALKALLGIGLGLVVLSALSKK